MNDYHSTISALRAYGILSIFSRYKSVLLDEKGCHGGRIEFKRLSAMHSKFTCVLLNHLYPHRVHPVNNNKTRFI